jgi:hypothetical protein
MKNVALFYGVQEKLIKSAEKCKRLCFFFLFLSAYNAQNLTKKS